MSESPDFVPYIPPRTKMTTDEIGRYLTQLSALERDFRGLGIPPRFPFCELEVPLPSPFSLWLKEKYGLGDFALMCKKYCHYDGDHSQGYCGEAVRGVSVEMYAEWLRIKDTIPVDPEYSAAVKRHNFIGEAYEAERRMFEAQRAAQEPVKLGYLPLYSVLQKAISSGDFAKASGHAHDLAEALAAAAVAMEFSHDLPPTGRPERHKETDDEIDEFYANRADEEYSDEETRDERVARGDEDTENPADEDRRAMGGDEEEY
jgi:hypothetical protein